MKRLAVAIVLLLAVLLTVGCATTPKPPPEDFYVALAESSARWSAYLIARNNLDEAAIAKEYLTAVNVDQVLTYQGWIDLVTAAPLEAKYKLAIHDAISLVKAYMPQPEESLTPLAKKIIKAVILGGMTGIDIALSENI